MAVLPLTQAEQDAMPKSRGATYPKGVALYCPCGRTGWVAGVSAHRANTLSKLCERPTKVFRSVEDAQEYAVDQRLDREAAQGRLAEEARTELTVLHGNDHQPDDEEAHAVPSKPTGRPRGRPPGSPNRFPRALDVPRESLQTGGDGHHGVRCEGVVSARCYARFDQVSTIEQFGPFKGGLFDYLVAIEDAYWVMIKELREGNIAMLVEAG